MDLTDLRLMNAAGWCKDIETVHKLAKTPVHEITVGSFTLNPRPGNEGSVFWESPDGTCALNSLGLPNVGLCESGKLLLEMNRIVADAEKTFRVSVAGFSPQEYGELTREVLRRAPDTDVIELNCGCPNVWGATGQKPIASFNQALMSGIFSEVEKVLDEEGLHPIVAVKLSPYSDPTMQDEMIALVKKQIHFIDEIVTSNTFPNAFGWSGEKAAITPGGGFAGMSGRAMKAIALGQAARFHAAFEHTDLTVVGVGGIVSGSDILDFARTGVTTVQIGTHYFLHGEKVFSELLQEVAELV